MGWDFSPIEGLKLIIDWRIFGNTRLDSTRRHWGSLCGASQVGTVGNLLYSICKTLDLINSAKLEYEVNQFKSIHRIGCRKRASLVQSVQSSPNNCNHALRIETGEPN